MAKVVILDDVCKGCYLCASACPKKVLAPAKDKLNKKGYRPIEAVNPDAAFHIDIEYLYYTGQKAEIQLHILLF